MPRTALIALAAQFFAFVLPALGDEDLSYDEYLAAQIAMISVAEEYCGFSYDPNLRAEFETAIARKISDPHYGNLVSILREEIVEALMDLTLRQLQTECKDLEFTYRFAGFLSGPVANP